MKTNPLLIFAAAILVLAASLFLWSHLPRAPRFSPPLVSTSSPSASSYPTSPSTTIRGEITCLPHRAGTQQTEECLIGLRGDDGSYYGLLGLKQEDIVSGKWTTGVRVVVVGDLSVVPDSKYAIVGTLSIQSIVFDAAP